MFRKILPIFIVTALAQSNGLAESLRALPVDPSEITPERPAEVETEAEDSREAVPLPAGSVKLPDLKPAKKTDAPKDISDLPTGEDAVRLQIFLDQSNFGPGVIDGKPGRFTILAVQSWNETRGNRPDDMRPVMADARREVSHVFARATVPKGATKWVNSSLSHSKAAQAKSKRMSYRSIAEFMAERYHTDVEFILELNGSKDTWRAKVGSSLIVPNVKPFLIENVSGKLFKEDPALSERHAVVDTKMNQVRIFEAAPAALVIEEEGDLVSDQPVLVKPRANQALVASFPITPGKPQFIHYGVWTLKNSVELPVWRYDQSLLTTGKRSNDYLNIPPGPNSPVGIIWNGLSKSGIGLHGTSDPETIGRARSAGCIRLANWDAIRIPTLIRPGATVEVR